MQKIARAVRHGLLAVSAMLVFIVFLYVAAVRYADPALFPVRAGDDTGNAYRLQPENSLPYNDP